MNRGPLLLQYTLMELWQQNADFTLVQSIFIGLFLFVCGIVVCAAIGYMQLATILEMGYPKRTKKQKRQWAWVALKGHSLLNKMFLWKLCREAPKKHFYLWIAFAIHGLNNFVLASLPLSYICMIVTKGAGWSMVLLLHGPIAYFAFVAVVTFIPSILWIPSERNRYRRK